MQRLVITTVGTSLLTNQIDRSSDEENDWYEKLLETANYSDEEMLNSEHIIDIIEELKARAKNKLDGDIEDFRKASAEINGIYGLGLYDKNIEQAKLDHHCLIYTDTAQGRYCAIMLENFLQSKGINNTLLLSSENFSTDSNEQFMEGIANLVPILKQKIFDDYKGYTICFNLVGGFKAMQGYFNTIGMLYADEIIYIFEGSNQVIRIPKLPIVIDKSQVDKYAIPLAVMDIGAVPISWELANKVPNDWLTYTGQEIGLSVWGKLIWNECKSELLCQDKLLNLPKFIPQLEYLPSLEDDYKNTTDVNKKIILQEKLARVAFFFIKYRDGISALKADDILRLRKYENTDIEHINITKKELRVSCKVINSNKLSLRFFGTHEWIYKKEGIKK
ncbi:putative CRISPR-associated protein [Anabaena azotica]|uniref:putative CRISPR-associated protein n=1 Tax=Anabaena azotica TaxID=197653 RepID=UPI0039A549C4